MSKQGSNDNDLLRRAITKASRKEKLSRDEQRALDRAKKEQHERTQREVLRACPKKLYVEMSGRQHKILDQQATRYGLPLLGKDIDLFAVLRSFHDLLAKHGDAIAGESPDVDGSDSVWAEECRKERALLLRLDRLTKCGQLLPRVFVHELLQSVANHIRQAGELLQKQGNAEGFAILDESLIAAEHDINLKLGTMQPLSETIETSKE